MTDRSRNVEDVLPPGTQIEEFVIERELQSGGFGVTYLAQDRSLGRRVAIKEYLPREWGGRRSDGSVGPRSSSHAKDYQWGLTRFLEEARTLARLDHPRIVRVHRVIEAWGTAYMVMEYVEGRDLEEALKAEGPWPEARVRALLEELLPGLALVHAAGLIHRDIKPANVMLRSDGTPVLIDFGAARYAAGVHSHSLTSVLTPGYAPHEQYHEAAGQQGAWTDMYALGAVAYRALSGQVPVEAPRRVEAAARRQGDPLAPVSQAAAGGVSESFGAAVTAALAVFSEGRPRDVAAWRAQWDAAEDGGAMGEDEAGKDDGGRSGNVVPPVFTGGLGAQPGSRRPRVRGAARPVAYGAAALVVVAGLAFGIMNRMGGGGAGSPSESSVADFSAASGSGTAGGGAGGSGTAGEDTGGSGTAGGGAGGSETAGGGAGGSETTGGGTGDTAEASEEALELDRAAWSAIQTGLAREGFDPGAPDGVPGRATRAAIRGWQTARGQSATGYLNAASMQVLRDAGGGSGLPYSPVLGRAWSASHVDEHGWTDLHYAAALNRPDLVRRLLDAGAAIDARFRPGGNTGQLVDTLRAFDAPAVIRELVNNDVFTATPLLLSVSAGVEMVELLLDRGANLEAASAFGSLLHDAVFYGVEMVELLLDRGANLEVADPIGNTPLHVAVSFDLVEVVELLLDRGANLEAVNGIGQTPLDVADTDAVRSVLLAAAGCSRSMGLLGRLTHTRRGTLDGNCSTEHYPDGEYALYYGFTLDEAAEVTMEMTSSDVDSWLALRRGSSPGSVEPLEEDDDGGTRVDARIERYLAPGSYTIEATTLDAGETGDFTLTVTVGSAPRECSRSMGLLGRLTYTLRGTLDGSCSSEHYPDGEYALYYGFTLNEAAEVTMEMTSPDVDSWLALRRGSSPGSVEPLEEDDDGGTRVDARIERYLAPGSYTIEATTLDAGETGDFTLTVTVRTRTPPFLPEPADVAGDGGGIRYERELFVDGAFSAAIEFVGDEDTYRITVSSSGRLTVHTTGGTDTFGELLDASGNVLGSDDDGGADTNFRLTWSVNPGTYYVRVRHFADDGTGDYDVIARLAAL